MKAYCLIVSYQCANSLLYAVAFRMYDLDNDGNISRDELLSILNMMVGSNISAEQVSEICHIVCIIIVSPLIDLRCIVTWKLIKLIELTNRS